jgi:hypothetical protein
VAVTVSLSDDNRVLGSCCGARCSEEKGNSTMLGVCERCKIKEKFTYGEKILQRKQLQFSSVYVRTLLLYVSGVHDISIWVPFVASHVKTAPSPVMCF